MRISARALAAGATLTFLLIAQRAIAQAPPQKPPTDPTVYVTKTGTQYHAAKCSTVRGDKQPMKLSAAAKIYGRCDVCKPPRLADVPKKPAVERAVPEPPAPAEPKVPATGKAKSPPADRQCRAVTKAGVRCTRDAQKGRNYCWQH
jgi:hypothetical protein